MTDPRWYSAMNVVSHVQTDTTPGAVPKKVEELWAVSIMLAAVQEIEQKQYWLQPVSDKEGSPDVRTLFVDKVYSGDRSNDYSMQDVEVVTYSAASAARGETLPEFVLRTKLSKDKAYDDVTTILVWVQVAPPPSDAKEWMAVLARAKTKVPSVFVLGQSHPVDPTYHLMQVYPRPFPIAVDYDASDLLVNQGYAGVLDLARGTKKKSRISPAEEHCPFESLGIVCKRIQVS